jgi:hypothetical protein
MQGTAARLWLLHALTSLARDRRYILLLLYCLMDLISMATRIAVHGHA